MSHRMRWLILALCLLPFLPGIVGPFQLDDAINLQPMFAALAEGDWQGAMFGGHAGFLGRPLAVASFVLNDLLFGQLPLTYKLGNLLLHGLNGLLVFALARQVVPMLRTSNRKPNNDNVALLTTALWLLHPLQASTVLYVVQRMTELATVGMLASLWMAVRYLRGNDFGTIRNLRTLALVAACSGLALLAKETAVLTPVLIGVLALFAPSPTTPEQRRDRNTFITLAVGMPMLFGALLLAWRWNDVVAGYAPRDFTLSQRLATEPVVLLDYLRSIFWPDLRRMGLSLDPTLHEPGDAASFAATIALALCASMAIALRRNYPAPALAMLWFLACHLLESTIIPIELAFEHRNYLALLGPAMLVATTLADASDRLRKKLPAVLGGILCVALATITVTRAREWADEGRFLTLEAERHPGSFRALNNLAEYNHRKGDVQGMARVTQAMAERFPDNFFVQSQRVILVACRLLPGPIDWDALRGAALHHPADPWASGSLVAIADNINTTTCNGLNPKQLQDFIDGLRSEYRARGLHANMRDADVALAHLHENTEPRITESTDD